MADNRKTKVFINGGEGTTGLRIQERFAARDDITLIPIDSALRKDPAEISKKMNDSDITFLCLPDAAAVSAVSLIENPNVRILDASTAHRTAPGWAYGFPELSASFRENIQSGNRVAVPGCHATGFISLVYPLIAAGILAKDSLLSAFSLTGYSGAGKKAIAQYEAPDRILSHTSVSGAPAPLDAPQPYALLQQHKHLKEMTAISGLMIPPVFSPIIADYYSGMLVTLPLHMEMLKKKMTVTDLYEFYAAHYQNQPLIRVLSPEDALIASNFLPSNGLSGIDDMEIFVCGNEERITLCSRFDNLGKGASGAAIQCMNIMLGLPEETGLKTAKTIEASI